MNTNISPKRAIVILTRSVSSHWLIFLNDQLKQSPHLKQEYKIYMVIDNPINPIPTTPRFIPAANVEIVYVPDPICRTNNYSNSSTSSNLKDIVAWDKALCFFNCICPFQYEYIWFLEDDVFVDNISIIQNIDGKYPTSDLLCSFHLRFEEDAEWNHWGNIIHKIPPPFSHSLVAVSRLSRRLLSKIDDYVKDRRELLFIEALFTTLALHNEYIVDTPEELKTITYDHKWTPDEILANETTPKIYHPIKTQEIHEEIRRRLLGDKIMK